MNFFVTATDTDVGKSYVCRHLAKEFINMGLKTAYFKPFQSGIIDGILGDAQQVKQTANDVTIMNSYITKTPSTPLISAQIDGIEIHIKKVREDFETLKANHDITIVEGSGGLYVPVKKNVLMSDVIKALNLPTLIVARPDLGTINHTLMTVKCLKSEGISVIGIVISNFPEETNDPVILRAKEMIENFCSSKVISVIKHNQTDF